MLNQLCFIMTINKNFKGVICDCVLHNLSMMQNLNIKIFYLVIYFIVFKTLFSTGPQHTACPGVFDI